MENILYALKFTADLFLWIIVCKILMDTAASIGEKFKEFFICLLRKVRKY
jgi:hypothetical protein